MTGNTNVIRDPLADEAGCKRDLEVLKDLKVNSIRVYETDYNQNHDACMKMLSDAGIYVMLDISIPKVSVNRKNPMWDTEMHSYFIKKVDSFSKYDNVIAYIIGNEVSNDVETTPASAFVKASLRDIKSYLKSKKIDIPVGYVDNDDPKFRDSLISYFNCGDDPLARADFFGVNTYRWCGSDLTFESSGYKSMVEPFIKYSIPSIITEYGCITAERSFDELKAILGPDMQDITSGAILYEYSLEPNEYGIVQVSYGSSDVKKLKYYDNFKSAVASVKPKGVKESDYKSSNGISDCPKVTDSWRCSEKLPPSPSEKACECLKNSLKCSLSSSFDIESESDSKAATKFADLVCGLTDCSEIGTNATKGEYGKFSFCNPKEKFSWIANKNFMNKKGASDSCKIDGVSTSENSKPSVSDLSTCEKYIEDISVSKSGYGSDSKSSSNDSSSSKSSAIKSTAKATGFSLFVVSSILFVLSNF
ncbi:hypothetical protein BB561_004247 [Smittium simulii]|uniref:1,3-beta-glucanosyltransferase n=1 Tax=Smittium simulii TaxID=133385 RepID=A0A2T9YHA5_9FUNG|nr:hypothetical protein BB561_004247 [Smittium simulii]